MHALSSPRDLIPFDIIVLRDLVRFGVLADDQIARRYFDPRLAADRLEVLAADGWIQPWERLIRNANLFSATQRGVTAARCGLRLSKPSLEHLRHDLTLVDLADYLERHEPTAEFKTEREVGRLLRGGASRPPGGAYDAAAAGHRPDGLLLVGGKCIAIELEHSEKTDYLYAKACRWFAQNPRVDSVRWYVDNEKIITRIRRVNVQHGFADDIDVSYGPFPPGVVMRQWGRDK